MKRRAFSHWAAAAAATPGLGWVPAQAQTGAVKPIAGKEYEVIEPRAPVEAPAGKIEVVEFFWYKCIHCSAFEPQLQAWAPTLPKDVVLRRVPVAFNDSFVPQQRLFFGLEALGLIEKLHVKVFQAIHTEKIKLDDGPSIFDWVTRQGVDRAKFEAQYNAFGMAAKTTRARQLQDAYRVAGVPALGVAGRYYTDGAMAGGMERALRVTEALVALARGGK